MAGSKSKFDNFTRALSDVLKVSHAEMKDMLLKEKVAKTAKRKTKRGASAHARRAED